MKFYRIPFFNCKYYNYKFNIKFCHNQGSNVNLVHLKHRTLLSLVGTEALDLLQGLITNDMKHLKEGASSLYSIFLNNKGKVLYDTIIYRKHDSRETFLVECDHSIVQSLLKHLTMYKLRRKVEYHPMIDEMKIWAVYDHNSTSILNQILELNTKLKNQNVISRANKNISIQLSDNIFIYRDPRIFEFSLRILTKANVTHDEMKKILSSNIQIKDNISDYRVFRYKLGVGEGVQDFPVGLLFPLEVNCDYLHGISFQKGCYIGQELTARTYHTGMVRKRIMPLLFNNICNESIKYDDKIVDTCGKVVGKIIGQEGSYGLGLVRLADSLFFTTLTVRNCTLQVVKPQWWLQDGKKLEVSIKTGKD